MSARSVVLVVFRSSSAEGPQACGIPARAGAGGSAGGGRNLIWHLREVLSDGDNPGSAVQEC